MESSSPDSADVGLMSPILLLDVDDCVENDNEETDLDMERVLARCS
jgi:hypothetical protein